MLCLLSALPKGRMYNINRTGPSTEPCGPPLLALECEGDMIKLESIRWYDSNHSDNYSDTQITTQIMLITNMIYRRASLNTQQSNPWSRWVTAAEDHTQCHCLLREGRQEGWWFLSELSHSFVINQGVVVFTLFPNRCCHPHIATSLWATADNYQNFESVVRVTPNV